MSQKFSIQIRPLNMDLTTRRLVVDIESENYVEAVKTAIGWHGKGQNATGALIIKVFPLSMVEEVSS